MKTFVATLLTGLSLSLFFSTAYAIPADDVDCSECVDTVDIAVNAITSSRIKDGQIRNQDLAINAITSDRIKDG